MKYIIILLLLCSCASDIHWRVPHKTGLETYTRYKRGWGYYENCKTYKSTPLKKSRYKILVK